MMYDNNYCEPIVGNSLDLDIDDCNCEIRADVIVEKTSPSVRLWGQIKDCSGYPIPNALIKLVKVIYCNGSYKYEGIAHTISDCYGFYQFDLCADDCKNNSYRVIVGKSVTGREKVIYSGGNCDVCNDDNCDPCGDDCCGCCHSDCSCNTHHYPVPPCKNTSTSCCDYDNCNKSFTSYFRHSDEIDETEECYTVEFVDLTSKSKKESRLSGYFKY